MVHIILEDSEFFYYVKAGFEALLLIITSTWLLLLRTGDINSCCGRFNPVINILLWFSVLTAIKR